MRYRNENTVVHLLLCNLLISFIFVSDWHRTCVWTILSVEGVVCEGLYQRSEVINREPGWAASQHGPFFCFC